MKCSSSKAGPMSRYTRGGSPTSRSCRYAPPGSAPISRPRVRVVVVTHRGRQSVDGVLGIDDGHHPPSPPRVEACLEVGPAGLDRLHVERHVAVHDRHVGPGHSCHLAEHAAERLLLEAPLILSHACPYPPPGTMNP